MRLSLERVVPTPLREKINNYNSWVWNQEVIMNEGEQVFVQAPSGTGKTTLMHLLYGLRTDYTGMIHWSAYKMSNISREQLSQIRASYVSIVFQDMRLFPELTAWENLEVKRKLANVVKEHEVVAMMERLGIKDKMESKASTLSYGEQQRVAIIRALLQPFSWLLMDEPFSHLDNANTQKAISLIKEVVEMNRAGIILADLEANNYFTYSRKLLL